MPTSVHGSAPVLTRGTLTRPGARRASRSRSRRRAWAAAAPRGRGGGGPRRARRERRAARRCRRGRRRTRPRRARARRARRGARRTRGRACGRPRLAEPVTMSTGSVRRAPSARAPRSGSRRAPTNIPRRRRALEARQRVRDTGRRSRSTMRPTRRRPLDAEMPPQLPVLLAALDRHAERRPDDVRADTGCRGDLAPVPLLVDERLADVEEDGADAPRSAAVFQQSLDELEIVGRRDLHEPRVAGDDADPPAGPLDERRAVRRARRAPPRTRPRSRSATNACGVCTATRLSRSTVSATTPPSTRLTVSRERQPGNDAVEPFAEPPSTARSPRRRREGARRRGRARRARPAGPRRARCAPTRPASPRR